MTYAVLTAFAAAFLGWLLGWLGRQSSDATDELALVVDGMLPGIQCGQCGYPGCRPYAEAMIANQAPVTLCPPGGSQLAAKLAELLNTNANPKRVKPGTMAYAQTAYIDEPACIGCSLCLPACPFDAIVGSQQALHTVIAEHCTGCELCVPVCPVDCISMLPASDMERVIPSATLQI